jgi:hypothetical protein
LTTPALESQTSAVPPPSTTPLWGSLVCAELYRCPITRGLTASATVSIIVDRYHPHSVKQHTAIAAKTRAEVDAFHAAALKAGGVKNRAPGLRRPNYYAVFVLDLEGNIETAFIILRCEQY